MTSLVPNSRGNYHWPTAFLGFRQQFHPPSFWKKPETLLKVYIKKNIKKKCRVFAWLHDATILYQEETLLLPVRYILNSFCASFVLNK
jgi:hypothetical protein